jgi:hypothetical protein
VLPTEKTKDLANSISKAKEVAAGSLGEVGALPGKKLR